MPCEKKTEEWMLIIIQGSDRTKMNFADFGELSAFVKNYRNNFSKDTRFVIHNDGWADIDIYVTDKRTDTAEENNLPEY